MDLKKLLETPLVWPKKLDVKKSYTRIQDDHDGTFEGSVFIMFGPDGDAYIGSDTSKLIRFRNYFGGGVSLRTYNALVILAEAIRLDNEACPQIKNNI